ncbi:5185_t:CDS:2 [Rhizophagus irregularis]|nr:5185_t:CDS:2 [Rhizophagus irregularis]
MGEPNNTVSRGKSSTKKPITASPVSLPKNLELPTAEISQYTSSSNDDLHIPTRLTLETSISKKNLTDIPNEIFVQICANLPPSDLFSLTLVCKKLKGLLCSPGSKETQAIWRNSRMRFMRFLQSPPPHNMDEKSYIVLKQLDKGCQFCNEKGYVKVYWEFRVRCCDLCLDDHTMRDDEKQGWVDQNEEFASRFMQEILIHKQEEQSEQIAKFEESFTQSMNPNYMPQAPTQQKRIFIRQPQLTTAPMNIPTMASMAPMTSVSPMVNMVSTPTIPSMGLTNPQPQFHQIIPHMMNRSQFMITTPPAQQLFHHQSFVPRITRQIISPQQQIIPSHLMTGAPQMLSQSQMLPPQMVSPHCFGNPQFHHF